MLITKLLSQHDDTGAEGRFPISNRKFFQTTESWGKNIFALILRRVLMMQYAHPVKKEKCRKFLFELLGTEARKPQKFSFGGLSARRRRRTRRATWRTRSATWRTCSVFHEDASQVPQLTRWSGTNHSKLL